MSALIRIAVIDDDEAVLDSLRLYFARQNIETGCFASAKEFLSTIAGGQRFDCIVSDVRMPGMSGLDLVHRLKEDGSLAPVVLITGHGDVDMAVAAIKVGAFDSSKSRSTKLACLPASKTRSKRVSSLKSMRPSWKSCDLASARFRPGNVRSWSSPWPACRTRK